MTLTAPAHIRGRICGKRVDLVEARSEWAHTAIAAGHTAKELAKALNLSQKAVYRRFEEALRRAAEKPEPTPERKARDCIRVRSSIGLISLPSGPIDMDGMGPDPRPETAPRDGTKFSTRQPDPASIFIAALRAELGRAGHAEPM